MTQGKIFQLVGFMKSVIIQLEKRSTFIIFGNKLLMQSYFRKCECVKSKLLFDFMRAG